MIKTLIIGVFYFASVACSAGCITRTHKGHQGYQGVVEFEESAIGFELGGRLQTISVHEGDTVVQGATLALLDDALDRTARQARVREAEAAHKQASAVRAGARPEDIEAASARLGAAVANEILAEKNWVRQKSLLDNAAVSKETVDGYDAQLSRTRAERQALEENLAALKQGTRRVDIAAAEAQAKAVASSVALDDTRIARHTLLAPFSGTVLDTHIQPGEVVSAGTPVVTLGDTLHPYADIFVPQGDIANVRIGQKATLRVDSVKHFFSGAVERIGKRTEFTPRYLFSEQERPLLVIRVRIRMNDAKQELHAGIPAFVTWNTPRSEP